MFFIMNMHCYQERPKPDFIAPNIPHLPENHAQNCTARVTLTPKTSTDATQRVGLCRHIGNNIWPSSITRLHTAPSLLVVLLDVKEIGVIPRPHRRKNALTGTR